ncbi:hypothetical protein GOBAR_DD33069 [Gossypium barbadense]|nr:hypothetical protein GOBAR_DD33069 [Gossypium barbadense]
MATLFIHELTYYLTTYTVHEKQQLKLTCLELDLLGPNLLFLAEVCHRGLMFQGKSETCLMVKCAHILAWKNDRQKSGGFASIDAIDLSGKHEVDLDTNIWKLRLNSHGHIIGTKYLSDLVEKQHTTRNHDDKEHHDGSAKKPHKFSFDKDAENMINKVKKALENGEGCRVYGVLDVQRVAGNFHISVHALNIYVAQMVNNFFSQHCNFVSHPNS